MSEAVLAEVAMGNRSHDPALARVAEPPFSIHRADTLTVKSLRPHLTCPTCGSARLQEGRREPDTIIYRCLHCWALFGSAVSAPEPVLEG
jgi:DNA-directed RNA polymerase subunit RPC12/RpoP